MDKIKPLPGTLWVWDGYEYLPASRYNEYNVQDVKDAHERLCVALGKPTNTSTSMTKMVNEVLLQLDEARRR